MPSKFVDVTFAFKSPSRGGKEILTERVVREDRDIGEIVVQEVGIRGAFGVVVGAGRRTHRPCEAETKTNKRQLQARWVLDVAQWRADKYRHWIRRRGNPRRARAEWRRSRSTSSLAGFPQTAADATTYQIIGAGALRNDGSSPSERAVWQRRTQITHWVNLHSRLALSPATICPSTFLVTCYYLLEVNIKKSDSFLPFLQCEECPNKYICCLELFDSVRVFWRRVPVFLCLICTKNKRGKLGEGARRPRPRLTTSSGFCDVTSFDLIRSLSPLDLSLHPIFPQFP